MATKENPNTQDLGRYTTRVSVNYLGALVASVVAASVAVPEQKRPEPFPDIQVAVPRGHTVSPGPHTERYLRISLKK